MSKATIRVEDQTHTYTKLPALKDLGVGVLFYFVDEGWSSRGLCLSTDEGYVSFTNDDIHHWSDYEDQYKSVTLAPVGTRVIIEA